METLCFEACDLRDVFGRGSCAKQNNQFGLNALVFQPSTLDPRPSTLNPRPPTLDPRPSTLDPKLIHLHVKRKCSCDDSPIVAEQQMNLGFDPYRAQRRLSRRSTMPVCIPNAPWYICASSRMT